MQTLITVSRTRRFVVLRAACLLGALLPLALIGCGGNNDSDPTVVVSPSIVTLPYHASQTFTATIPHWQDQSVNWSVEEGTAGGTITAAGVYTSPATDGTYHVLATSTVYPNWVGSATVVVASTAPTPSPSPTVSPSPSPSASPSSGGGTVIVN